MAFSKTGGVCAFSVILSAKPFSIGLNACLLTPALTGQNMNSDVLDVLNFLSLLSKRSFCFPLDSAALSDSWCALILIIALHQYGFLFFFLFFWGVWSSIVVIFLLKL